MSERIITLAALKFRILENDDVACIPRIFTFAFKFHDKYSRIYC